MGNYIFFSFVFFCFVRLRGLESRSCVFFEACLGSLKSYLSVSLRLQEVNVGGVRNGKAGEEEEGRWW